MTDNIIKFNDESGVFIIYSDNNVISPNTFSDNYHDVKEGPELPKIKAPGFEFIFAIFAVLLVLLIRKKYQNLC